MGSSCRRLTAHTVLTKLGIENVGVLFMRGVLVDPTRHKGVERLNPTYIITIEDIEGTLAMEGVEIREGDAVFLLPHWMGTSLDGGQRDVQHQ